jgi:E3 ubiquitin-protein ligase RGLG
MLSGPTNFAPIIREAINICKELRAYHILVIIADGEVIKIKDTADAIVEASNYPLSIIMVGVGDGPFELMEEFDDKLPARRFDNVEFTKFNYIH